MKKLLLVLSLTLLMSGCSTNTESTTDGSVSPKDSNRTDVELTIETKDWVNLQGEGFSVMAPMGWTLTPGQGTDSYVGTIAGDGMSLNFDFGMYSGDEFKDQPGYVSSKEIIDGKDGLIYLPSNTVEGSMGLYVQSSDTQILSMTAVAASMHERLVLLEVLRSVRF